MTYGNFYPLKNLRKLHFIQDFIRKVKLNSQRGIFYIVRCYIEKVYQRVGIQDERRKRY